ncbi:hypothetical protein GLP52_15660 [Sulfitobacter sp. M22]|nr:hypothetical protein [Sulfitobacter sp. M22]
MSGSKMVFMSWIKFVFLTFILILPVSVAANSVGQAIAVNQGAFLDRGGQRFQLNQGFALVLDDVITTDAAGQVQLLFQDETRVVVGPGSQLKVESILFNGPATASQFTVSAVEGAFRFLSGNSAKSAYSIRTPNGTMGIRGTEFDFSVAPQSAVNLVTFRGEVQLCNRRNQCALLRGACAAVSLNSNGVFAVAKTKAEKATLLADGFPFVAEQNGLRRDFRTRTWTCGSQTATFGEQSPLIQSPAPDRPTDPGPGGGGAGAGGGAGGGGSEGPGASAGGGGPGAGAGNGGGGAGSGGSGAGGASGGAGGG